MKAKISYVSPAEKNKRDEYYKLVNFIMLEGGIPKASTHLVMKYKNYENWKSLLVKDNIVGGLEFLPKHRGRINADSPVYLIEGDFLEE